MSSEMLKKCKVAPAVSVVMPCYNVQQTLDAAVESVLAQTFADFELILVNDGSSDLTPEICDSYADERIRVIHKPNGGLASARNAGMLAATGRYIALLDSDDLYEPNKLREHVCHLDARVDVGISFSHSQFINDDGERLAMYQRGQTKGITPRLVLCRNPIGNGSAAVIRRRALQGVLGPSGAEQSVGLFDTSLRQSEDVEFWLRFICTSKWRIEGIPKPLTLYRINSQGLSADTTAQLESWQRFIDYAQGYAPRLINRYHSLARSYQLRYLARRAVKSGQAVQALELMRQALVGDYRILVQEPVRTLVTLGAAFALSLATPFVRLLRKDAMS